MRELLASSLWTAGSAFVSLLDCDNHKGNDRNGLHRDCETYSIDKTKER
jgi:hypothetical protein